MDINVRPKMGCVRGKIGLTGQIDRLQQGIISSRIHIFELRIKIELCIDHRSEGVST